MSDAADATAEPGMQIAYVCGLLDDTSPTRATQVRWVRALAAHPCVEHVTVLTHRVRCAALPSNVTAREIGKRGSLAYLRFALGSLHASHRGVDFFFVAQGGPFPALLVPARLLLGKPVYHWKAHAHVSRRMRWYVRWCDDLVFTAGAESFPLDVPERRIVGHGIDTVFFRPPTHPISPQRDVLVLGRVSPIKNIEEILRTVARCEERFGVRYDVDVVGPSARNQAGYVEELRKLASDLGLTDRVRLLGPVPPDQIREMFSRYRVMMSCSRGAFDKTNAEAMACHLPLLTDNAATLEVLDASVREMVELPSDPDARADRLREVLALSPEERDALGHRLRAIVTRDHSLDSFFDKILFEIKQHHPRLRSPTCETGP